MHTPFYNGLMLLQIDWDNFKDPVIAIKIAVLIFVGFPLVALASKAPHGLSKKRMSAQGVMVLRKSIFYIGTTVIILMILQNLGFKLDVLLGAAGVAGIAIGFASQTSVSNIISGLFLISERPFEIGDLIRVGDTTGEVMSIDLMSVKLRTFDNQFIRLPNENLIKTQVNNLTHYPIRRVDIQVGVAYKEDVNRVKAVLLDIAKDHAQVLDEPEPLILLQNFGDSSLDFLFAVWCVKDDHLLLKQTMYDLIKSRFDADDIEIPFPHVSLYTGSVTAPLPIQIAGQSSVPTTATDPSVPSQGATDD